MTDAAQDSGFRRLFFGLVLVLAVAALAGSCWWHYLLLRQIAGAGGAVYQHFLATLLPNCITALALLVLALLFTNKIKEIETRRLVEPIAAQLRQELSQAGERSADLERQLRSWQEAVSREAKQRKGGDVLSPAEVDSIRLAVRDMLHALAVALVAPHTEARVRAHCHLADPEREELVPFCKWSADESDPDSLRPVPYAEDGSDAMVIVQAYRRKTVRFSVLTEGHQDRVPASVGVSADLSAVLAAPICYPKAGRTETLGTISVDLSGSPGPVNLDSRQAANAIQLFAEGFYMLAKEWDLLRERPRSG